MLPAARGRTGASVSGILLDEAAMENTEQPDANRQVGAEIKSPEVMLKLFVSASSSL
jgi:hypothetical protein